MKLKWRKELQVNGMTKREAKSHVKRHNPNVRNIRVAKPHGRTATSKRLVVA